MKTHLPRVKNLYYRSIVSHALFREALAGTGGRTGATETPGGGGHLLVDRLASTTERTGTTKTSGGGGHHVDVWICRFKLVDVVSKPVRNMKKVRRPCRKTIHLWMFGWEM